MNGLASKNSGWQAGSGGFAQVMTLVPTTFTNRGEPSALRKSTDTGTIGAFTVVVPPCCGGLPSVLKYQCRCGFPFESCPSVKYCPLKFTTESMFGIPNRAWAIPFLAVGGPTCVNFKPAAATVVASIASSSCARTLTALARATRYTIKVIRNSLFKESSPPSRFIEPTLSTRRTAGTQQRHIMLVKHLSKGTWSQLSPVLIQ